MIQKPSFYLKDSEIDVLANEMRTKRNWDLYEGRILISEKEAKEYLGWTKKIFRKAEKNIRWYLDSKIEVIIIKKEILAGRWQK